MSKIGDLFIIATPIGNLGDITLRALEILKQVDLIAAEDTRHSGLLLNHYGIKTPVISFHAHNEAKQTKVVLEKLKQGKSIALISDAGTPLVSDPGGGLVKEVRRSGFKVIPIPGACAAITALSVSGIATDKFVFEGFLPAKKQQQLARLQELANEARTIIFYESPHRLLKTIVNMQTIFGEDRYAVIAKELTKIFETIYGDTLLGLQNWLIEKPERQKGEFVILVQGVNENREVDAEVVRVLKLLLKGMPHKQAVALAAEITGISKNELYKLSLDLKK